MQAGTILLHYDARYCIEHATCISAKPHNKTIQFVIWLNFIGTFNISRLHCLFAFVRNLNILL